MPPDREMPSFDGDLAGKCRKRRRNYVKYIRYPLSVVAVLRQYSVKPNVRYTGRHLKGIEMERVGKVVDFLVVSVSILMVVTGLASLLRF